MIEIEKKFSLTEDEKTKLIEGAEPLGRKVFTDTYYDTLDWGLTLKDTWLRSREGKYELKVPLREISHDRIVDQYRELETNEEIAEHLVLSIEGSTLEEALRKTDYKPFCTLTTTREKYKKDGYGIDIDAVDFGYVVTEIELMVTNEDEVEKATNKILQFAKSHGIMPGKVRGKVAEYLRRNSPSHYEALRSVGIVS